jgi:hypothetical protein
MRDVQGNSVRRMPVWLVGLLALVLVATVYPVSPNAPAVKAQESNLVFFDATGQTLGGPFFEYWEAKGGLGRFGEPVSPLIERDGRWMQWFQFMRLEVATQDFSQASSADVRTPALGRVVAESTGFSRWHPAFQPFNGRVGSGVRWFATGHTLANGFLEWWNREDGATRLGPPISQEFSINGTVYQYFERGALSWTSENGVELVALGYYDAALNNSLRLAGERPEGVPSYGATASQPVASSGERWIDVNLSTYVLTAYEGSTPVLSSYMVDGAAATPTVTGTFYIYWKLDSQTMRGRNPDGSEWVTENVPYVMYFYADYAIHGAYWRSSFGYSGSRGCVNLPVGTAAWLYDWAYYGTRVEVHY